MNEDWRLEVRCDEHGVAAELMDRLEARELEHDLSTAFHDRVVVSRDGPTVFLYAGTRDQAERAEKLIHSLAEKHGWKLEAELRRWHPVAEDWEDPDKPLPSEDAARQVEREALMGREREEAEEQGYLEFEVRLDFPTHRDAAEFEQQLREEGLRPVRRWKFVLVGARDEDEANALAQRLKQEAPEGTRVRAEGTWKAAMSEMPPNPFAGFGGLGV
jgi:hypothetical protein